MELDPAVIFGLPEMRSSTLDAVMLATSSGVCFPEIPSSSHTLLFNMGLVEFRGLVLLSVWQSEAIKLQYFLL